MVGLKAVLNLIEKPANALSRVGPDVKKRLEAISFKNICGISLKRKYKMKMC